VQLTDLYLNILGFVAGSLTAISQLPQVIKVVKSKNTQSISLWTYIILSIGISLWLVYGIMSNDLPLILANSITIVFTIIIMIYKIIYK